MSFQKLAFEIGYALEKQTMEKTAGRAEATAAGAIPFLSPGGQIASGFLSEDGRGVQTGLSSFGGAISGGALGVLLGAAIHGSPNSDNINALRRYLLAGASLGGGLGAYLGHGPNKKDTLNKKKA